MLFGIAGEFIATCKGKSLIHNEGYRIPMSFECQLLSLHILRYIHPHVDCSIKVSICETTAEVWVSDTIFMHLKEIHSLNKHPVSLKEQGRVIR